MKKIYIGYSDFPGFPVREIEWAVSQARRVGADCELVSEPWDGLRKEEYFWNKKPFLYPVYGNGGPDGPANEKVGSSGNGDSLE